MTQLNEKYVNINDVENKKKYAYDVFVMLSNSYKPIGGLKGNGFESPEDMINKIPFWKLYFRNGVLECVIMYKDKNGRKMVALGTSGTIKSKLELKNILKNEFERSYFDVSGHLLRFLVKNFGEDFLIKYAVPIKSDNIHNNSGELCIAYPKLCKFSYKTTIGQGTDVEKIRLGKMNKPLTFLEFIIFSE